MSGETPRWYYAWSVAFQFMGILGGTVVFLWVTVPKADTDRRSGEVQTRLVGVEAQIAEVRSRVAAATEEVAVERAKAESKLAELQVEHQTRPQLEIVPSIEEVPAVLDVREIRLQVSVKNIGITSAHIDKIEIGAFQGRLSDDAMDIVNRTQSIAWCLDVLSRQPMNDAEKAAYTSAETLFGELRQNCPHGQLFLIGEAENDADVEWRKAERAVDTRSVDLDLAPQQTVFEPAVFLLTQDLHYGGWLRLVVTLHAEDGQLHYSFIVPTRHSPVDQVSIGETKVVRYSVARFGTPESAVYRWAPDASLIPREVPQDSELPPAVPHERESCPEPQPTQTPSLKVEN